MCKVISVILPSLAAALLGCVKEPKTRAPSRNADHASPEVVFAAYNRAHAKRDWRTLFELLSPGWRNYHIANLVDFAPRGDEEGKVAETIDRYFDAKKAERLKLDKLTQEEKLRLYSSCAMDKKRLFVEINLRLDQLGEERTTLSALRKVVRRGLKAKGLATSTGFVTGETAKTGGKSVKFREKIEVEVPVYFIKQGTKWFFAMRQEWEREK